MPSETEQNTGRLIISQQERPRELQLWLVDELTVLAEAMGESVTPERLRIYAKDLSVSSEQLGIALTRARRECRFFPKIAELRELAGDSRPEERDEVETQAAFQAVIHSLERNGLRG